MFGHVSLPTKNYSYGVRSGIQNIEGVREQLWLAHRYKNDRIAEERARRVKVEELLKDKCPELAESHEQWQRASVVLEELVTTAKAGNAKARKKVLREDSRVAIQEARKAKKAAYDYYKAVKAACYKRPDVSEGLKLIDDESLVNMKRLYAETPCFWGTANFVAQSQGSIRSGAPPRFQRWTGEGSLAVQLQKGLTVAKAMAGTDNRLRIEVLSDKLAYVHFRIGSEGRDPVWAVLPTVWHRDIPADAMIKWAYIDRTKMANRDVYKVRFAVSRESGWKDPECHYTGKVGIDVGWRKTARGLRVAYWVDDSGRSGECILPEREIPRWAMVDELRSNRDLRFNEVIEEFRGWLKTVEIPDWMAERVEHVRQWRSPARLAAVMMAWREYPEFEPAAFERFDLWRKADKRRWQHEARSRKRANRWRKDVFRNFAAKMRRRYRTVVLEELNLAKLKRRPGVESQSEEAIRIYQTIAAVGEFRQQLVETFANVEWLPAEYTTQQCHLCGHVEPKQGEDLIHTCSGCGESWDQDRNAAVNILRGVVCGSPIGV